MRKEKRREQKRREEKEKRREEREQESFVWLHLTRSSTLSAAHASAGFAADRIFSVAHQYPWKLAIGDIRAYLEELKGQTDALPESTTSKIWSLLQMGYNREQLCSAVALIKDIS